MKTDFNWQNGTWVKDQPRAAEHEICIAGDWAPIRAFSQILLDDPETVYGDVLAELRASDLKIANLECPLTEKSVAMSKSGSVLKGSPDHIKGLTCVPFDLVSLANNHVFDYGTEGFQDTADLLRARRIQYVGAGLTRKAATEPLIVNLGGTKIAFISFSEGEDLTGASDGPGVFGWEIDTVSAAVRKSKKLADLAVVVCHAGIEYIPFPPPYLVKALHSITHAGADLIVGHHPHVPQGCQILADVPIVYSLGNFVFYQPTDLIYRKVGYLLKVKVSAGALTAIKLVPYQIRDQGLSLLKGAPLARFWEKMEQISRPLETRQGVADAWNGFLRSYGLAGFFNEVDMLLAKLKEDPPKGAAMVRNRVATMQHREHWTDAMTRIIDGTIDESPDWAYGLAREWLTARL